MKRIKRTTKKSRTKRRRTSGRRAGEESRRRMGRGRSATLVVVPLNGNSGGKVSRVEDKDSSNEGGRSRERDLDCEG